MITHLYLILNLALRHSAAEDCVWNKDTDYPDTPPLIFDGYFNLVLPILQQDNKREVR